ncbi:histone H1.8-like [Cavia porcellus]|uniref:histone H1.8-like n=1 Tax=Cavia porcellus TaxID=10141 RepID=UPI002FE0D29F
MAPGSITNCSSSSSSTAGPAEPPKYGKPGPTSNRVMVTRRHPTVLRMVLEALQAGEQRRGTSVAAIKLYILHKYPTVDVTRFKYLLKQAIATGMRRGLLAKPINSKARGATGSFKLVPKRQKKPQCSRKSTRTGPAGSSKKNIAEPCEARAPHKQAKALETAPQGGCKAKGTGPQQVVTKKDPPKVSWGFLNCPQAWQEAQGPRQQEQARRHRSPWENFNCSLQGWKMCCLPEGYKTRSEGRPRAWTQSHCCLQNRHCCLQNRHCFQGWGPQDQDSVSSQEGWGPQEPQAWGVKSS